MRVHGSALIAIALLATPGCAGRAISVGTTPVANVAGEPLRVMTFNIRYGTAQDGADSWQNRRPLTIGTIRDYDPALLGVQEALRFQLDEIEAALTQFAEVGVGRDDGVEAGEYSAILYDRRRLDLLDSGTFWLSDTPEVPGSKSWGNNITRIVTWARFRDRSTGHTFYHYNTHWDHESQPARECSATLTLDRIVARAVPADPVLLTADFNSGEDNAAFLTLLRQHGSGAGAVHLRDTFRALHPDVPVTATYHGYKGETPGPKIDAVLASPEWTVLESAIDTSNENGRYPSDHYPVTATVALRRR
jgi:endonuclease/exonuclease/phosphatase family metal-dependent hydrolase